MRLANQFSFCALLAAASLMLSGWGGAALAAEPGAGGATAAVARPQSGPVAHDGTGRAEDRLVVKFVDEALVRLEGRRFVSRSGRDLTAVSEILGRHGNPDPLRLFARDEASIDAMRAKAEARSGRRLADLNGYFELLVDPARREDLMQALRSSPLVETVYRAPLPAPPPADIPPTTPDWEDDLLHLDAAPTGIDAEYAWTRPGGTGQGIYVVDIEYSWREDHEDLGTTVGATACFTPTDLYIEHGTAVMGQLFGGRNGYGVTGMVPDATPGFVTDYPVDSFYSVARAVDCAAGLMEPGDVMLIEAQTAGPRGAYVPVEWDPAEYDAISAASALGIVVVEAAGNGNENLDDAAFLGRFDRSVRDSGAIIVGAGATVHDFFYPDRSRLSFSTYGSRVDVQGWGSYVQTTGYGDSFDGGGDPRQYYTLTFNGTSSASPMVAASAAILQGVQKACGGAPISPLAVRQILAETGSPQVDGPYAGNIGPRPDLRAALEHVDVDNDFDGYAECAGDCDDTTASISPDAPETNDGLDNQCPGGTGHGIVDEISGVAGFFDPEDDTSFCWDAQDGATEYEVRRSDDPRMSGPCAGGTTSGTCWTDAEQPQPGAVFHYLVRAAQPFAGSWGAGSDGVERTTVCP